MPSPSDEPRPAATGAVLREYARPLTRPLTRSARPSA